MKTSNLFQVVQNRTKDLSKKQSNTFNTNDWLVENLVGKSVERHEVINMIIEARFNHLGYKVEDFSEEELNKTIDALYKTSKNGLDTSVSDSNNNSSFSYNPKYDGYKLIKKGNMISIEKVK